MTNIEAKAKLEEIASDLQNKLEEYKELFKSGELDIKKYDIKFLDTKSIYSNYLEDYSSPDDIIEMITEFKEKCEPLNGNINFSIKYIEPTSEYDDSSVNGNHFVCIYCTVKNEVSEITINHMFRDFIANELKPQDYKGYTKHPDCKLLKLFMDGNIDFKTLQQTTYADCKI